MDCSHTLKKIDRVHRGWAIFIFGAIFTLLNIVYYIMSPDIVTLIFIPLTAVLYLAYGMKTIKSKPRFIGRCTKCGVIVPLDTFE